MSFSCRWFAPPKGFLKINVDAAFQIRWRGEGGKRATRVMVVTNNKEALLVLRSFVFICSYEAVI